MITLSDSSFGGSVGWVRKFSQSTRLSDDSLAQRNLLPGETGAFVIPLPQRSARIGVAFAQCIGAVSRKLPSSLARGRGVLSLRSERRFVRSSRRREQLRPVVRAALISLLPIALICIGQPVEARITNIQIDSRVPRLRRRLIRRRRPIRTAHGRRIRRGKSKRPAERSDHRYRVRTAQFARQWWSTPWILDHKAPRHDPRPTTRSCTMYRIAEI